jgi:hypothetical protein
LNSNRGVSQFVIDIELPIKVQSVTLTNSLFLNTFNFKNQESNNISKENPLQSVQTLSDHFIKRGVALVLSDNK